MRKRSSPKVTSRLSWEVVSIRQGARTAAAARAGERGIGDAEGGLGGGAQHPGPGITREDIALDPDDGGDVGVPVGAGEFVGGIEDADGAGFVAVATLVAALGGPERRLGCSDILDLLVQGRLVVLGLDNQHDVGFCRDFKVFFWQCRASSVMMAPAATPRSASKVCAAGISLDFAAMST
ncbi:MAG: hypothetical protein JO007_20300 [Alphaproteobacteria bacterium]|nr:hypothetical protein [Alphaproteobacteria bacterium]